MYQQHPLSSAFPAMPDEDFRALVEDIRAHGQRDVATLADGMVIDGWHRYRACVALGIPCRFETFVGMDAVAFVRSKNQHRRHYQKSQQAAIEVALTTWADAHRPKKEEAASSFSSDKVAAAATFSTNEEMARRAGTGIRTITDAKAAHEAGLGDVVRDGKLSAEKAAAIARADPILAEKVAHGEVSPTEAVEQITLRREPPVEPRSAERQEPEQRRSPAPVREREPTEADSLRARIDELEGEVRTLARELDAATKDNIAMGEAFDADDKLSVLHRQNQDLRELNRVLQSRLDGEINTNAELKRAVLSAQRKIERLEKARG